MIPKIIHYCWFGGQKIPKEHQGYINGWKKVNPGYKIMRWDESNSPMHLPYLKSAKKHSKWANMANLTRLYALSKHGGIYLDTDMKAIKSFKKLLNDQCFFGFEQGKEGSADFWVNNAIIGAVPEHKFIKLCYDSILKKFDGTEEANLSAPRIITDLLKEKRNLKKYGFQKLKDITLYPVEVFYPILYNEVYKTHELKKYITPETIAVHMWARTWYTKEKLLLIVDDLQKWSADNAKTIDWLNGQLTTHVAAVDDLKKWSADNAKTIEWLNGQLVVHISAVDDLKKWSADNAKTIESLNNQLTAHVSAYAELTERLNKSEEITKKVDSANIALNEESASLREKVSNLLISKEELAEQIDKFIKKERKLAEVIQAKDIELQASEKKIFELIQTVNNHVKLLAENQIIEKTLGSQVTKLNNEKNELNTELKTKESILKEKEKYFNENINEFKGKNDLLTVKIEKFETLLALNNKEISNLKLIVLEKEKQLADKENRLISLVAKLEKQENDFELKINEYLKNESKLLAVNNEKNVQLETKNELLDGLYKNEKRLIYEAGKKDEMMEHLKKHIIEINIEIEKIKDSYRLEMETSSRLNKEVDEFKEKIGTYEKLYVNRSLTGIIKDRITKRK
jgi:hypothetical protein